MKHLLRQLLILLAVCFGWTACNNDILQDDSTKKDDILITDAQRSDGSTLRGLTADLKAIWSEGDQVAVVKNNVQIGTMTPQTWGSPRTQLKAQITGTIHIGDALTLVYPRTGRDYTGQKGTLADIASQYDYATADVQVVSFNGNSGATTDARFDNQQAIVRFLLTDGTNPLPVKELTISADGLKQNDTTEGDITITPVSATDDIYAALSGVNGRVTLSASTDTDQYTYTTTGIKTFANGKFYTVTVAMKSESEQMLSQPLTIEAIEDGTRVNFTSQGTGKLEYSRDMITWTAFSVQGFSLQAGDKIYFRGNSETYYPGSTPSIISCTDPCYIYGNIMSLIAMTDFEWRKELPANDTFRSLFENNDNIQNHPTKDLLLPATTLTQNCYSSMFKGCTGLTRAPVLPAQKLRGGCYQYMFSGCTKLAYIKCLATDIEAVDCTTNWVEDVNSSGTFVKASGMTDWGTGSNGIPSGWTIQE